VTSGCAADLCDACSCEPVYRGCIGADQTPEQCPALGCATPDCCSSDEQCQQIPCAPPGTPFGCGVCNTDPGTCTDDAECHAQDPTMICEPIACTCTGEKTCVVGCVDDTTCAEGTTCNTALARCAPTACSGAAGCPDDFDCVDNRCARRTCADDLVCDGYCVLGQCYSGRGECRPPAP
jgi:hypothetical protein